MIYQSGQPFPVQGQGSSLKTVDDPVTLWLVDLISFSVLLLCKNQSQTKDVGV